MKEWITNRNPVYEALRVRRRHFFNLLIQQDIRIEGRLKQIVDFARQYKLPVREATKQQLGQIDRNHQGLALETSSYPYAALADLLAYSKGRGEPGFFLLLDLIQDPQNLGSLLRTAELMGIHGVIIPSSQAAQVTPGVVHASAGATEHLLITQYNLVQAIERLKKDLDIWVYGLDATPEAKSPDQLNLKGGIALVVGNEGEGLRSLVRKNCDEIMCLPQYGQIDSLNAAVAGSIALYLARQARP
ncbi:MAG: 23S rRNA (guanosine(2251)-2'-O)-methyltransferase RlmB [Chloroflexi bacterium]|jgi:23S rRNA (guanosine2251-2'-O)-methyltransferase|nr:23S rRNA (guanosine(2251)-2'-O)-methyltransferase RlmB [Chloroflexota bacterium]